MVKKILSHWQVILKVFGGITATTSVIAILWGVFTFVDNTNTANKTVNSLSTKVDSMGVRIDNRLDHIVKTLGNIKDDNEQTKSTVQSLQRSYVQYISKDDRVTKADLIKFLDGLELKKNGSNELQIPLKPED